MTLRVGINGFGRIGRNVLRAIIESKRKDIEVVAINNRSSLKVCAHLLKYDSVHGTFPYEISTSENNLHVGNEKIFVSNETTIDGIRWDKSNVDLVMECTGKFNNAEECQKHINAGASKVLISAPAKDADLTVVYGVNDENINSSHNIISNASCTTNCLAPVAKVLNDNFGIEEGFMTTVHSYTGDQPTIDRDHKDVYRARAAAVNMIPTSTGAAEAVGKVLPELSGKLSGVAVRVPTSNVSMIDLTFTSKKQTTSEEVNQAVRQTVDNSQLKNVLSYTDEKLVSTDFFHNPHSSIFHTDQTFVTGSKLVRILSWYDNEWGFSNRMADTAVEISKHL
jgi:glyceraldehyde 3-phosphate dehydrogenase